VHIAVLYKTQIFMGFMVMSGGGYEEAARSNSASSSF
jgi:hypothetical protein